MYRIEIKKQKKWLYIYYLCMNFCSWILNDESEAVLQFKCVSGMYSNLLPFSWVTVSFFNFQLRLLSSCLAELYVLCSNTYSSKAFVLSRGVLNVFSLTHVMIFETPANARSIARSQRPNNKNNLNFIFFSNCQQEEMNMESIVENGVMALMTLIALMALTGFLTSSSGRCVR